LDKIQTAWQTSYAPNIPQFLLQRLDSPERLNTTTSNRILLRRYIFRYSIREITSVSFVLKVVQKLIPLFELKTTRIFNNRTSYIVMNPYKNTFFDTFINEKGEIASVFPRMPQIKRNSFAVGRERRDARGCCRAAGRLASFNAYPVSRSISSLGRVFCGNASS